MNNVRERSACAPELNLRTIISYLSSDDTQGLSQQQFLNAIAEMLERNDEHAVQASHSGASLRQ